ncbi:MAG: hypothetical protein ABSE86_13120 [Bryobacteraceae bacterium]
MLPGKMFFWTLGLRLIATPVLFLEVCYAEMLQVFAESVAD